MGGKLNSVTHKWRYFTIADCEREEKWLTEMASNGWRFIATNGFLYTFERCAPEKVVYRLDYSGLSEGNRADYYTMFRDYGWEYLQDINGFSYFRKSAEGIAPEDLEIFSDGESRLRMHRKFMWAKLPIVYLLFCCTMLANQRSYEQIIGRVLAGTLRKNDVFLISLTLFLIFFVVVITVRTFSQYHKIKKMYQKDA